MAFSVFFLILVRLSHPTDRCYTSSARTLPLALARGPDPGIIPSSRCPDWAASLIRRTFSRRNDVSLELHLAVVLGDGFAAECLGQLSTPWVCSHQSTHHERFVERYQHRNGFEDVLSYSFKSQPLNSWMVSMFARLVDCWARFCLCSGLWRWSPPGAGRKQTGAPPLRSPLPSCHRRTKCPTCHQSRPPARFLCGTRSS